MSLSPKRKTEMRLMTCRANKRRVENHTRQSNENRVYDASKVLHGPALLLNREYLYFEGESRVYCYFTAIHFPAESITKMSPKVGRALPNAMGARPEASPFFHPTQCRTLDTTEYHATAMLVFSLTGANDARRSYCIARHHRLGWTSPT